MGQLRQAAVLDRLELEGSSAHEMPRPVAIEPQYWSTEPDEPIVLYDGELTIGTNAGLHGGQGQVRFDWQPFPYVALEMQIDPDAGLDLHEEMTLTLAGEGASAAATSGRTSPLAWPTWSLARRAEASQLHC